MKAYQELTKEELLALKAELETAYEDANLLMIKDLEQNFPDYEIGYSDHTRPDKNMMVLTTAFNYGATVIGKHFTFDKSLEGIDSDYTNKGQRTIGFV